MSGDECFLPNSSLNEKIGKVLSVSFLLWIISKKKIHGYQIIKILKQEAGFMNIGSAHIYPLLSEMLKHNLLEVKESLEGKRKKKFYSLTPLGKKHLVHMKKIMFKSGLRSEFFRQMVK